MNRPATIATEVEVSTAELMTHALAVVRCGACREEWRASIPPGADPGRLECPMCGVMCSTVVSASERLLEEVTV